MRLIGAGLLAFAALSFTGCATQSKPAFPTAEVVARKSGSEVAVLERGRTIYATRCTECHVARPVTRFSAGEWPAQVARMAPRAKLSSEDRFAVESYLVAASSSQ
jgi:mono/diheme cytochrome c family protein